MDAKSPQTSRLGASFSLLGLTAFVKTTDCPPLSSYALGALRIACFWRFTAMLMRAEAKSFVFGTTLVWGAFSYSQGSR